MLFIDSPLEPPAEPAPLDELELPPATQPSTMASTMASASAFTLVANDESSPFGKGSLLEHAPVTKMAAFGLQRGMGALPRGVAASDAMVDAINDALS